VEAGLALDGGCAGAPRPWDAKAPGGEDVTLTRKLQRTLIDLCSCRCCGSFARWRGSKELCSRAAAIALAADSSGESPKDGRAGFTTVSRGGQGRGAVVEREAPRSSPSWSCWSWRRSVGTAAGGAWQPELVTLPDALRWRGAPGRDGLIAGAGAEDVELGRTRTYRGREPRQTARRAGFVYRTRAERRNRD